MYTFIRIGPRGFYPNGYDMPLRCYQESLHLGPCISEERWDSTEELCCGLACNRIVCGTKAAHLLGLGLVRV